jgi:hypothetical protein
LIRPKLLTVTGDGDLYIGEKEFPEAGTFTWDVPLSVRYIHVCAIGAGGLYSGSNGGQAGGGGGLAWANQIEVEPGETLNIQVGTPSGGSNNPEATSGIYRFADPDDTDSAKEWIIEATGGNGFSGDGGTYRFGSNAMGSTGGGRGGDGSFGNVRYGIYGAGGGAAGYTGNGGSGGGGVPGENSGGASGGTSYQYDGAIGQFPGGVGGGVGVKGRGETAQSPGVQNPGSPARDGLPGSGGDGVEFGGGGTGPQGGNAGHGALRIIWGIRFSYPDNADVKE